MEFNKIIPAYKREIDKFLKRVEINHITCMAPLHKNGKSWTEKECESWINKGRYNKIPIKNIFLLNDHSNPNIKTIDDEDNDLRSALNKCTKLINNKIKNYCEYGENLYHLNVQLKDSIKLIDEKIGTMNYDAWIKATYNDDVDDIFYLLINGKKIPKSKSIIDIQTYCMNTINNEFNLRQLLLYHLKACLVDTYSTFLVLPSKEINPKIKFDCSPTDICELLLAITNAGVISDSEKLKAILMEIFDISPEEFKKSAYDIRNRKKNKSVFVQKLSDKLNAIPGSGKKVALK